MKVQIFNNPQDYAKWVEQYGEDVDFVFLPMVVNAAGSGGEKIVVTYRDKSPQGPEKPAVDLDMSPQ